MLSAMADKPHTSHHLTTLARLYISKKMFTLCSETFVRCYHPLRTSAWEAVPKCILQKKKNYTVFSDVCTMLSAIADKCMRGSTEVYYTQKMFILYLVTFLRCYQPLRTSSWGAVPRWCAAWCRGFPFSRWRFFCQFICIYIWYLYIFNVYMYLKCVCI